MENSDGRSQEHRSSSCSLGKEAVRLPHWGGVSDWGRVPRNRSLWVADTHLLAPEQPWWPARSSPVRWSSWSPHCTHSGLAAGMYRWASPVGTAHCCIHWLRGIGPGRRWLSWHGKSPGKGASLLMRRKERHRDHVTVDMVLRVPAAMLEYSHSTHTVYMNTHMSTRRLDKYIPVHYDHTTHTSPPQHTYVTL